MEAPPASRILIKTFGAALLSNSGRADHLRACMLQIQVVNQATQFIQRAFDWRPDAGSQKIDEAQFRKAKCSLYLYYRCLQKRFIVL